MENEQKPAEGAQASQTSDSVYLKLGPKASNYVSPTNLFAISGPEVIKMDKNLLIANLSAKQALANKHIVEATEEDYNNYQNASKQGVDPMSHFEVIGEHYKAIPGAGDPAQSMTLAPTDAEAPKSSPDLGLGRSGLPGPGQENSPLLNKEAGDGAETNRVNVQTELPQSQTGAAAGNTSAKIAGEIVEDDEDDEPTQSEMIDELKGNTKVTEAEKKSLTKLSLPDLKKLYTKYNKA